MQRAVDDLAERIQRSVVVDDPGVHLLYASRHFGDEDDVRVRAVLQRDAGPQAKAHVLAQGVAAWSGPGVIPPDAAIGMRRRVCVPIRWRGVLLGLLMVMDGDSTLTDAQLAEVAGAARDLAPVLAAREQDEETVVRERTVRDLVDTEAAVRRRAVADLTPLAGRFACVAAVEVALAGPGAAAEAALRDAVRFRGACLSAVSGDSALLLLGSPRPLAADVLHAQAGAVLARARELSGGRTT